MELTTATLRVYVDTVDSISDEEASALSETAYNDVTAVLNEGTYFTASNGKKMYDLEAVSYTHLDVYKRQGSLRRNSRNPENGEEERR